MVCSAHAASVSAVRRRSPIARRPPATDLTIEHAISLFLDSRLALGLLETSLKVQACQLRRLFRPALTEPLRTLSIERMQELRRALAAAPSHRNSAPLSSETLSFCREIARKFTRWCAAQGRLPADPMAVEKKRVAWLHDEVNRLRADLEAMRKERDRVRQQLRAAAGGAG